MNNPPLEFSDSSFCLVRLFREPIYREDTEDWETVRAQRDKLQYYLHQVGRELVLDEAEGYAFQRQIEADGVERIPRLGRRTPLTYAATLLLVCLREEFCRFDTTNPDATILTKTRTQLHDMVAAFLPESTNQVRDVGKLDAAITRLLDLNFLRRINPDTDEYEVMRIIKARLGPSELTAIKQRLQAYANADTDRE
jgi:hypothetical protein